MNKCPVISLQGRQRQKSRVENSRSLSAMLSDGIADMPSQKHARVYVFKKPVLQSEMQSLTDLSKTDLTNNVRCIPTITKIPPDEL